VEIDYKLVGRHNPGSDGVGIGTSSRKVGGRVT
jgi:hypothetical protein